MAAALDAVIPSAVSPAVRFNVSGTRYTVGKRLDDRESECVFIRANVLLN